MAHLNYVPREPFIPFHRSRKRFKLLVCHRRAGKTVACVADVIARAIQEKKPNAEYAYIGPFRQQAKKIAWRYLKDMTENGLRVGNPRESDLSVKLANGATITIYGADNPDAFRGLYFDGVIIDEYKDIKPTLWGEVILPALLDRDGWATFIGTFEGKNHFYKLYQKAVASESWFTMLLKASESGILTPEQIQLAKDESTPEQFAQEMECDPNASVPGTYFSSIIAEMEEDGRIGTYPYNPDLPVYASSDLGYSDSTAWWFWQVDEQGPILIDHYENHGQPLEHYFDVLNGKNYNYEIIWLPHDAKATSLQTGRTTIEQFLRKNYPCRIVPKQSKQHGIDAARMILPRCRINENTCFGGVEALRSYRRMYNAKLDTYSNEPLHDWASNSADAFRYFALVTNSTYNPQKEEPKPEPLIKPPEYTLDELWEDHDRWRQRIIRL